MSQYDNEQLKAALATGPIGVEINTSSTAFQQYSSGIFQCDVELCGNQVDDLTAFALLVGYGVQDGTEYFILKNSWGTGWGEAGFMNIISKTGFGESGLNIHPIVVSTINSSASHASALTSLSFVLAAVATMTVALF